MRIFAQASHNDIQGFPKQREAEGCVSPHRPATRIFKASRYREKQRDGYLRIGQPQGSLGLPDIETFRGMGIFALARHQDLQGFPIQREAGGQVSSHMQATRIFMTSRYREKQRDAYLRIGQPHGPLGLPDIGRGGGWVTSHRQATRIFRTSRYREKQGDGYPRICQPQGSLCLPDIERSRGMCIFAQASHNDIQGFPKQGEAEGCVSPHRPATRIFKASRYREKQRDGYLRIGQPQGSLGLPDMEKFRGMGIFALARHKDLQGFPIQREAG